MCKSVSIPDVAHVDRWGAWRSGPGPHSETFTPSGLSPFSRQNSANESSG